MSQKNVLLVKRDQMNKGGPFDLFLQKVAIVTGGGRGLGRTMALSLANAGADVVVTDILAPRAKEVAKEITRKGRSSLAIKADVSRPKEVQEMVDRVLEHYKRIDILVNNAGINIISPAENFSFKDWQKVVSINLTGVFLCSQAVGRVMIRQKKGKIINIASVVGLVGSPHDALAYNTSKAGVINLTRSLAVEWGEYQINVNAIAPGMIETELTRARLGEKDYYKYWIDRTPLKRIGKPEDLIGAVLFLASELSDWMTGQVLVIDGGYTAM